MSFEACLPRKIRVTDYEKLPVAGKLSDIDIELQDQYGNVITADAYGLLADDPISFTYLNGYQPPATETERLSRKFFALTELDTMQYIDDPGRYQYSLNHTKVIYREVEVGFDRFDNAIVVLQKQVWFFISFFSCTLKHTLCITTKTQQQKKNRNLLSL